MTPSERYSSFKLGLWLSRVSYSCFGNWLLCLASTSTPGEVFLWRCFLMIYFSVILSYPNWLYIYYLLSITFCDYEIYPYFLIIKEISIYFINFKLYFDLIITEGGSFIFQIVYFIITWTCSNFNYSVFMI